jgi:hypothetical protein
LTPVRAKTLAEDVGDTYIVLRRGARLEPYPPFKCTALYRKLARVPETPEGVLEFVGECGMLTAPHKRVSVDVFYSAIRKIRRAVDAYDKQAWPAVFDACQPVGRLTVQLIPGEPGSRPTLRYLVPDLLSAIWLQFADDISGGYPMRECKRPACRKWFKVGKEFGRDARRADADYCSDTCRMAHTYERSKGMKQ